jgi:hypothetical protein
VEEETEASCAWTAAVNVWGTHPEGCSGGRISDSGVHTLELPNRRFLMSFLKKALTSGVAAKAAQIVMREASKPENQRKAREMVQKLRKQRRRPS